MVLRTKKELHFLHRSFLFFIAVWINIYFLSKIFWNSIWRKSKCKWQTYGGYFVTNPNRLFSIVLFFFVKTLSILNLEIKISFFKQKYFLYIYHTGVSQFFIIWIIAFISILLSFCICSLLKWIRNVKCVKVVCKKKRKKNVKTKIAN